MNDPNACNHRTLAHNHVARVQECPDCGCISIHVGPVTLRLDAPSYESLLVVMVEAAAARRESVTPLRSTAQRGAA